MKKNTQAPAPSRPAKVLTGRDAQLMRRREFLKAFADRIKVLDAKIKAQLDPRLAKELEGEKTAVVEIKGTAYRVTHVVQPVPRYQDLINEFLEEDMLHELLGETDEQGHPVFMKENEWFTVRMLGRDKSAAQLSGEDLSA